MKSLSFPTVHLDLIDLRAHQETPCACLLYLVINEAFLIGVDMSLIGKGVSRSCEDSPTDMPIGMPIGSLYLVETQLAHYSNTR